MELGLNGKTALVTGASMGLGRAIAKSLASEGVRVLAVSRTEEMLLTLQREVAADGGERLEYLVQDFVAVDGPQAIYRGARAALGQIDILVKCWREPSAVNFCNRR